MVIMVPVLGMRSAMAGVSHGVTVSRDMRKPQRRATRGKRQGQKSHECEAQYSPHAARIAGVSDRSYRHLGAIG